MVRISRKPLLPDDYYSVLFKEQKITIDEDVTNNVEECFNFLVKFSNNKIIYGVNTGLGPMAQYRIEDKDQISLQYNLIRSHAAGSGEPLSADCVKAAMISRLKSLSLGYSGVHVDAIKLLEILINKNIIPFIHQHGGVGASGDLVQLSHLALNLIGEGEAYHNGKIHKVKDLYQRLGVTPLKIRLREGLGLINGTSVMSGIGIVNILDRKSVV